MGIFGLDRRALALWLLLVSPVARAGSDTGSSPAPVVLDAKLVRKINARLGLPLSTIYNAVLNHDRAEMLSLFQYALYRGPWLLKNRGEDVVREIQAGCKESGGSKEQCEPDLQRARRALEKGLELERRRAKDGYVLDNLYFAAAIFLEDAGYEVINPELKLVYATCGPANGPACKAESRRIDDVIEVLYALRDLAWYSLQKKERESNALRERLRGFRVPAGP